MYFKKSAAKVFRFPTNNAEKSANFDDFRRNNFLFTKPNCKKLHISKNQLKGNKSVFRLAIHE